MPTQYDDHVALMSEGRSRAERLLVARREPSDAEVKTLARALNATDRVKAGRERYEEDQELRRRIGQALKGEPAPGETGRFSAKTAARVIANDLVVAGKALAPSGATVALAGLTEFAPLSLTRPATNLLAAVPAKVVADPPTFAFLRKTPVANTPPRSRPVARSRSRTTLSSGSRTGSGSWRTSPSRWTSSGSRTPPSFGRSSRTRWATGSTSRSRRSSSIGTGNGEQMLGMLNTAGVQAQGLAADPVETLRRAVTKGSGRGCRAARRGDAPGDVGSR